MDGGLHLNTNFPVNIKTLVIWYLHRITNVSFNLAETLFSEVYEVKTRVSHWSLLVEKVNEFKRLI